MTADDRHPTDRLLVAAFVIAVIVAGCAGTDGDVAVNGADPGSLMRFIADDPQQILELDDLYELTTVFDWDLSESEAAAAWRGAAPFQATANGLVIPFPNPLMAMSRDAVIECGEVQAVEVALAGFHRGLLRLQWAGEDRRFGADRATDLRVGGASGPDTGIYHFDVSDHPLWRGTIARLRLVIRHRDADEVVVQRITGRGRAVRRAALDRALSRPAKVELGHDVRNAFLSPPGHAIARRLEIPQNSHLRIAFGVPRGLSQELEFRVVGRLQATDVPLFRRVLRPGEDKLGRWQEATIDLSRLQGEQAVLRLETASDKPFKLARGMPLWANPEVVCQVQQPRLNILLVVIDALRADRLSLYGHSRRTSPHIDAWAGRDGVVFRNVVAAAPWTLPSHVSLFTGLDAVRHGFNHDVGGIKNRGGMAPSSNLEMLAEVLRRAGYATGAFTGGAYVHPKFGFAQGFDEYAYWPNRARDKEELATGVERALRWMEQRRDVPFLFFLHTYEVHDPYRARQPFYEQLAGDGAETLDGVVAVRTPENSPKLGFQQQNRLVFRWWRPTPGERPITEAELPMVRTMYDAGVAYMDEYVGRLLEGIETLGLEDRTVVVFTADHGEALGRGGHFGHIDLYDHTVLVPMVIAIPGRQGAGRIVDEQVRSIDLFPTLLELVGVEKTSKVDGVSLVPLIDGQGSNVPREAWSYSAAANYGLSLREGNQLKYVFNDTVWDPIRGKQELFDLGQDPLEENDMAAQDARVPQLRERVRDYLGRRAVGLRLRVSNAGPGVLRGELSGQLVRPHGLKCIDLSRPFVRWIEMGRAEFEVPPGEEFTLHFEKTRGGELTVQGEIDEGASTAPFKHTFVLSDLRQTATLSYARPGWTRELSRSQQVATGFALWWHGAAMLHTASPAELDDELRAQLRELGYVE